MEITIAELLKKIEHAEQFCPKTYLFDMLFTMPLTPYDDTKPLVLTCIKNRYGPSNFTVDLTSMKNV